MAGHVLPACFLAHVTMAQSVVVLSRPCLAGRGINLFTIFRLPYLLTCSVKRQTKADTQTTEAGQWAEPVFY